MRPLQGTRILDLSRLLPGPFATLVLAERENGRAFLATKVGDLAVQLETGDQARCARIAFQAAPPVGWASSPTAPVPIGSPRIDDLAVCGRINSGPIPGAFADGESGIRISAGGWLTRRCSASPRR